jgi:hypothetical protein
MDADVFAVKVCALLFPESGHIPGAILQVAWPVTNPLAGAEFPSVFGPRRITITVGLYE